MISQQEVDDFLEHHGVKGMHWGVRKDDSGSGSRSRSLSPESRAKLKKAAIIGGTVVAASLLAAGAAYVAQNNDISVSSLLAGSGEKNISAGKAFADKAHTEPIGVIHASRGKNSGFEFLTKGGTDSPLHEYDLSGVHDLGPNSIRRYGRHNEKVAANILDPEGRKDFAGRPIFHEIILPKSLAEGVNNVEDVKKLVWPSLKDSYDAVYNKGRG
jgi:hypothetical protein